VEEHIVAPQPPAKKRRVTKKKKDHDEFLVEDDSEPSAGRGLPNAQRAQQTNHVVDDEIDEGLPRENLIISNEDQGRPTSAITKKGTHYSGVRQELDIPEGYVSFRPGSMFMTRRCKTETLDSGRDFFEEIEWQNRGKWRHTVAYHCPKAVYDAALEQKEKTEEKRNAAKARKDKKENDLILKAFQELFPNIPTNIRDAVIDHSFEKGSKRIGTIKDMPLEKRVTIAVRSHVLHNMTDFHDVLERKKDKLYDQTIGRERNNYDGFGREMAYDEFYGRKEGLYERVRDKFEGIIDQTIAPWKTQPQQV
jgi:hypothetical protein